MELNVSGGGFTWSNNRVDTECIREKLDRVFLSNPWSISFLNVNGIAKAAIESDNSRLLFSFIKEEGLGTVLSSNKSLRWIKNQMK